MVNWLGNAAGVPLDPSDPASMNQFVQGLTGKLTGLGVQLDVNALQAQLQKAVTDKVVSTMTGAVAQLAAKFVPGAGWAKSLYDGVSWLLSNAQQLTGVVQSFLDSLTSLANGDVAAVQANLVRAFNGVVPAVLNLATTQLGLGRLPGEIQKAVSFVPAQVDMVLRAAVSKLAGLASGGVGGGTTGGMFDGKLAAERAFTYQGQEYVLWVAQEKGVNKVKVAQKVGTGYKLIGVLTGSSFDDTGVTDPGAKPSAHLTALVSAAQALFQGNKPNPQRKPDKGTFPNLGALQQAVGTAEDVVVRDILANACKVLNAGCFAAGTKLLTRAGWRAVEEIQPGEEVLSRDEHDPAAEPGWKVVEARFQRTGCILHVHVGREVIRTTPEHPFYVDGAGWTAAGGLHAGDRIATLSGEWVVVGEVFDTGLYEPVYNLRVADWHTYFVGDDHWGWAAWAHNDYKQALDVLAAAPELQPTGVTAAQLKATGWFKTILSPAYKVQHTDLDEFKKAIELALDRSGYLKTGQYLSETTALAVKAAAEVPRQITIPVDLSQINPYAEGTPAYIKFQEGVIRNPAYRGYYVRIQKLDQQERAQLGTNTSWRLIQQLPGGKDFNLNRIKGLPYQLERAEAYQAQGLLREVEMPLGGGYVDLRLDNAQLVDAKAWTQDWWNGLSAGERATQVNKLRTQIIRYLDATSVTTYKLRLEFKYFVPPEVQSLVNSLTDSTQPTGVYGGRLTAVVL